MSSDPNALIVAIRLARLLHMFRELGVSLRQFEHAVPSQCVDLAVLEYEDRGRSRCVFEHGHFAKVGAFGEDR